MDALLLPAVVFAAVLLLAWGLVQLVAGADVAERKRIKQRLTGSGVAAAGPVSGAVAERGGTADITAEEEAGCANGWTIVDGAAAGVGAEGAPVNAFAKFGNAGCC